MAVALSFAPPASWPWQSAMPQIPDRACGIVATTMVMTKVVESDGRRYAELMICYRDKPDAPTTWLEIPKK